MRVFLTFFLSMDMYVALRQWTSGFQILKDRNDIKMRRTSRISKNTQKEIALAENVIHVQHFPSKCKV